MTTPTRRSFAQADWPLVWPIICDVARAGDTFACDPRMMEAQAREIWIEAPPGLTAVAADRGRILGTTLCRFALKWAKDAGFAGMQFNAAAESNLAAVAIYRRSGFAVVGTMPGAFAHPSSGRVGLHVMCRAF